LGRFRRRFMPEPPLRRLRRFRSSSDFNPKNATAELAAVAKQYGLASVTGDQYVGHWLEQDWSDNGISHQFSRTSPKSMSSACRT
jgi:hypothetical protein